jgi:hypothetical protein
MNVTTGNDASDKGAERRPTRWRHGAELGDASDKGAERRVKSVNFTDVSLFDFANDRAQNLYGGNFSAYAMALIERDRSLSEARRTKNDLESLILDIILPHGGVIARSQDLFGPGDIGDGVLFDFKVPSLRLVIEARSRFPREKPLEYKLLSAMQRIAIQMPDYRIALVIPDDLAPQEKERFLQFEAAGIEALKVCDIESLRKFVEALADPRAEQLEKALLAQTGTSSKSWARPKAID